VLLGTIVGVSTVTETVSFAFSDVRRYVAPQQILQRCLIDPVGRVRMLLVDSIAAGPVIIYSGMAVGVIALTLTAGMYCCTAAVLEHLIINLFFLEC
jgi:hypothetical protein